MVNIKSLSGIYTGTKSLLKLSEAKLPRFIEAPKGAVNVEVFNINKLGEQFKDMYVFRDSQGKLIRKYMVKPAKVQADDMSHTVTQRKVDKFDYRELGGDWLLNGDITRTVEKTTERTLSRYKLREETRIPFDYETGTYKVNEPEYYMHKLGLVSERDLTSKVSDIRTGANSIISRTTFRQNVNGDTITETSMIGEYAHGKAPKWLKAIREYLKPSHAYGRDGFEGVMPTRLNRGQTELYINPEYESITSSNGIKLDKKDPYLFLRLHSDKKQFCSEAEPIIARKLGFKETNPEYYRKSVPKRHETDEMPDMIAESVEYWGRTPNVKFDSNLDEMGNVDLNAMVQSLEGSIANHQSITIGNALNRLRNGDRVETLAHESQHLLDGRRIILAKMPLGDNYRIDEYGYFTWNGAGACPDRISPFSVEALGGWIKKGTEEYNEVSKLKQALTTYGVDCQSASGYENSLLEINANSKATKILEDYYKSFVAQKDFPNVTMFQMG